MDNYLWKNKNLIIILQWLIKKLKFGDIHFTRLIKYYEIWRMNLGFSNDHKKYVLGGAKSGLWTELSTLKILSQPIISDSKDVNWSIAVDKKLVLC